MQTDLTSKKNFLGWTTVEPLNNRGNNLTPSFKYPTKFIIFRKFTKLTKQPEQEQ